VDENVTLSGTLLATDPEGQATIFNVASQPAHGTLVLQSNGTFTFQPVAEFTGQDTFGVVVADSLGANASYQVTVTIRPVNDAPIAHDDEIRIPSGPTTLSLLANDTDIDGDIRQVTILTQPRGGAVTVNNGTVVTFQPENSFAGPTAFTYRVTDADGVTADASVKLVVGEFSGVVLLSDETTPGTPELHLYDGLRTTRLSTPLQAGVNIARFTIAPDGHHIGYVVTTPSFDQVLITDTQQPGSAQRIYSTSGTDPFHYTSVTFNQDATFAMIHDASLSSALKLALVHVPDGNVTVLGTSNSEIIDQGYSTPTNPSTAFNPVTNEFYLQAKVFDSTASPGAGGYYTVYSGTTSAPNVLIRIGSQYLGATAGPTGSGTQIQVTPDGGKVIYASTVITYPVTSVTNGLLVNDRKTGMESFAFRKFNAYEYPQPVYDLSPGGTHVCFILNVGSVPPTAGPGRIWYSDLSAPGSGTALSPVTDSNFNCKWASDSQHAVYYSANVGSPQEFWVSDAAQPGTAARLREPLANGDQVSFGAFATKGMMAVVGIAPSGSSTRDYYRATIDAPGSSVKFASGIPSILTGNMAANERATLLAYKKSEPVGGGTGTIYRLHLLSTQTSDYDLVLTRPDGTAGVLQFQFLPAP